MSAAEKKLIRLSKLMSLVLRHEPGKFGLTLDGEGFVPLDDLLAAVHTRIPDADEAQVRAVITDVEADKMRFTIEEREIRANYGHSFAGVIEHQQHTPPDLLLHGTVESALAGILVRGLLPMKRQFVHLTTNAEIAARVGARRGTPILLNVDARAAHTAGVVFYRPNAAFWLVATMPPQFLTKA